MDVVQALAALVAAKTLYRITCFDKHGNLKWVEEVPNLVTTEGLNNLLDATLGGTTPETAWYVGLINNAAFSALAAGDTLASHAGWTEFTTYTGNRQTWTKNGVAAAGAMSNSSSKASFPITGTATLNGAFLASAATGTTGVLYGEASFSSTRDVESGDTLNVQVDPSVTSA